MSEFMRKYGDGWSFTDPSGKVESVLSVIPHKGEWAAFETCPAGEPDDEDLPARIMARLAARVAYLEQENARLTSDLIRREGELEAESRRER